MCVHSPGFDKRLSNMKAINPFHFHHILPGRLYLAGQLLISNGRLSSPKCASSSLLHSFLFLLRSSSRRLEIEVQGEALFERSQSLLETESHIRGPCTDYQAQDSPEAGVLHQSVGTPHSSLCSRPQYPGVHNSLRVGLEFHIVARSE